MVKNPGRKEKPNAITKKTSVARVKASREYVRKYTQLSQ
jgi:hypothetical protein